LTFEIKKGTGNKMDLQPNSEILQRVSVLIHKAFGTLKPYTNLRIDFVPMDIRLRSDFSCKLASSESELSDSQFCVRVDSAMGHWYVLFPKYFASCLVSVMTTGSLESNDDGTVDSELGHSAISDAFNSLFGKIFCGTEAQESVLFVSPQCVLDKELALKNVIEFEYRYYNPLIGDGNFSVVAPQHSLWEKISTAPRTEIRFWSKQQGFDANFTKFKMLSNRYETKLHALVWLYLSLKIKSFNDGLFSIKELITDIPWDITREIVTFAIETYDALEFDNIQECRCLSQRSRVRSVLEVYDRSKSKGRLSCFDFILSRACEQNYFSVDKLEFSDILKKDYLQYYSLIDLDLEICTSDDIKDRIAHYEYLFYKLNWEGAKCLRNHYSLKAMQFKLHSYLDEFVITNV
jgi:hypothetical protein